MKRTPGEHPESVFFGTLRYNLTCGHHIAWSPTPDVLVENERECTTEVVSDLGNKRKCHRRLVKL